jgi:hypothetical protein
LYSIMDFVNFDNFVSLGLEFSLEETN